MWSSAIRRHIQVVAWSIGLATCWIMPALASPNRPEAVPEAGNDAGKDAVPAAIRNPGVQAVPPGPPAPTPPPLETDPGQRRAIRGCSVDQDCRGPRLSGLREFELAAFGPPGTASPWLDDDDPNGHNSVRQGRPGRHAAAGATGRRVARGTELRPDLPWLDTLQMPDLPVRWDDRVIKYLEFYKDDPRGRNTMRAWLRDQGKYRDLIVAHLRRARLPEDLLYVVMIESSYDPHEYSRVGASGLWQFMPAGGRIYGLASNRWIDERNDPLRSTEAAMLYWIDLYQRFGNWDLAMTAYNAGYGAVLKAVATYNTNDFWQLLEYENALPWESTIYVPKALAAAIVGHNREFFGYDEVEVAAPVEWDLASVPGAVPLSSVARAAGVDTDVIKQLNPQLRRDRTPPGMGDYLIRIPKGTSALFAERFPQLSSEWDRHDAYVVAHGERFEDIATKHGMSRRALAQLNGVTHESEVDGGTILVVPRVSEDDKQKNLAKAEAELYTSGSPKSRTDEPLLVAVPDKNFRIDGKTRGFYRVVTGDSLFGVARAFGVKRTDLAAWNGLDANAHLHPRMILQVFIAADHDLGDIALLDEGRMLVVSRGSEEHLEEIELRRGRERIVYKASKRESFEDIGKKFGLSARDLARINRRSYTSVLEPGDEIIVYKVKDASRAARAERQDKQHRRARKARERRTADR